MLHMTTPAGPGNTPAPQGGQMPGRVAWTLTLLLSLGAIAVVVAVVPSPLFDLDRFGVPKELALHLTALLGALITLSSITRLELSASDLLLAGYLAWSAASTVAAHNHWLATRALAVTVSGGAVHWIARQAARAGSGRWLTGGLALAVVLGGLTGAAQAYG